VLGPYWFNKSEISQMRRRIKLTIHQLKDYIQQNNTLPESPPLLSDNSEKELEDSSEDQLPCDLPVIVVKDRPSRVNNLPKDIPFNFSIRKRSKKVDVGHSEISELNLNDPPAETERLKDTFYM